MSIKTRILNTQVYNNLNKIQKAIYNKPSVYKEVEHNYLMAKNLGSEKWIEVKSPKPFYKNITLELLKKDENDSDIK